MRTIPLMLWQGAKKATASTSCSYIDGALLDVQVILIWKLRRGRACHLVQHVAVTKM